MAQATIDRGFSCIGADLINHARVLHRLTAVVDVNLCPAVDDRLITPAAALHRNHALRLAFPGVQVDLMAVVAPGVNGHLRDLQRLAVGTAPLSCQHMVQLLPYLRQGRVTP